MRWAFGFSFGLLAAALGSAASLVPVGVLPGGSGTATLTGLSADGTSAFGNSAGANGFEAFRWRLSTGIVGLGDLPGGGFSSFALGSDFGGNAIVGRGTPSISRGFRWTTAGMAQIAGLNGFTSSSDRAQALSNDGTVLAGWSNSLGNGQRATRWIGAGLGEILPDLDGGSVFSDALGISGDGTTIVGWSNSTAGKEAARWGNGAVFAIGDFPGGPVDAYANAANFDGSVIVGRGWDANSATAFRWSASRGMETLGQTFTGQVAFNSEAFDVSADGEIVVGRGNLPDFSGAFVWTRETGMVSVKQLLINQGVNVTGWTFNDARGISADGLTIAGNGVFNGQITGYVANLNPYHRGVRFGITNFTPAPGGTYIGSIPPPIEVTILDGDTEVLTTNAPFFGGGIFQVALSFSGTYRLAINGPGFLRRVSPPFTITHGYVTTGPLTLIPGDVDDSGEIDAADIDAVIAVFGSVNGDPGWNQDADMDGSGEVDAADIDIVIANFGLVDD